MNAKIVHGIQMAIDEYIDTRQDLFSFRFFLQSMNPIHRNYIAFGGGKSGTDVGFTVCRSAAHLKVYCEEHFLKNIYTARNIYYKCLKDDLLDSLAVIDPLLSSDDVAALDIFPASPRCLKYVLDRKEGVLNTEDFFNRGFTLTEEKLRMILRHPSYTYLIYELPPIQEWQMYNYLLRHNGQIKINNQKICQIVAEERVLRCRNNIRFIFWCCVLNARMRDFRERFWRPGGAQYMRLKESFTANRLLSQQ